MLQRCAKILTLSTENSYLALESSSMAPKVLPCCLFSLELNKICFHSERIGEDYLFLLIDSVMPCNDTVPIFLFLSAVGGQRSGEPRRVRE